MERRWPFGPPGMNTLIGQPSFSVDGVLDSRFGHVILDSACHCLGSLGSLAEGIRNCFLVNLNVNINQPSNYHYLLTITISNDDLS